MQMIDLIAGLAWDPEIRGFLAVLTGVVVLMGSVWLLLATNSGTRLGTLIAGAGFFGWMAIMGSVWWIYGIGYAGDRPVFVELEIVEENEETGAHLDFAENDVAETLRSADLPTAQEVLLAKAAELSETNAEYVEIIDGDLSVDVQAMSESGDQDIIDFGVAWLDFGVLTEDLLTGDQTDGLDATEIELLLAAENEKNSETTLSELAAVAPHIVPDDLEALGEWRLLSTAEMGEAQASAIAFLLESGEFSFDSQTEFKILNGYASGGKEGLPEDPNRWDRIWTQVRSALTIKHPTGYAMIQVQAVTAESIDNLPGTAPKRPIADENEPVISVVMVRDLGNLRQLPALVTIGSLLIFLAFCYMLHERDKVEMARRAEFAAAG
ncbi:MAG: hypothetical protein R8F63_16090 [Acidimicrobiales bacterium]|nr:hypothetical protein [Acidimicrobiales bacterium]